MKIAIVRSMAVGSILPLLILSGCDQPSSTSTPAKAPETEAPAQATTTKSPEAGAPQQSSSKPTYSAAGCGPEIKQLCADVEMGEGRVVKCLLSHRSELGEKCRESLGIAKTGQ